MLRRAMTRVRTQAIERVLTSIEQRTQLSRRSFTVDLEPADAVLEVTFVDRPEYKYRLVEVNQGTWSAEECPGEYLVGTETTPIRDIATGVNRIPVWAQRVYQDILEPIARGDAEMFSQIDAFLDELHDPQSVPNTSEAQEMRERIDDLLEKVAELSKRVDGSDTEVQKLRQQLDKLKDVVDRMPKGAWWRTATARVSAFMLKLAETPAAKQLAEAAIATMFPPGGGPPQLPPAS